MIIARLAGGLANQMGIYSAGLALATKLNTVVKLDLHKVNRDKLRNYELDKLGITATIATPRELRTVAHVSHYHIANKYRAFFGRLLPIPEPRVYREKYLYFDEHFFDLPDNIYLKGNFLSIKYYEPIYDLLLNEFELSKPLSKQSNRWLDMITQSNSVSIHVRRNDYVTDLKTRNFHSVMTIDYYLRAIQWMQNNLENPTFFVFSDDAEWPKKHIRAPGSTLHFVDCNDTANGYQDFELMRNCQHQIIANSGFSRWAAYLNRNAHKKVCMPTQWFAEKRIADSDVGPQDWKRIDH